MVCVIYLSGGFMVEVFYIYGSLWVSYVYYYFLLNLVVVVVFFGSSLVG